MELLRFDGRLWPVRAMSRLSVFAIQCKQRVNMLLICRHNSCYKGETTAVMHQE